MENRIKERRAELGMSQEQLARACGIGQSTVSEIEDGKHSPTLDVAFKIADALGKTLEELFIG